MKAFLVDISAFQIWFCDQGVIRTSNPLELVKDYRFATSSRAELPLDQIDRLGLRGQIHVAVPNHVRRHHQAGITAHVISSPTPYSFVRLSKDVYVESPEATLVRMASHLNRGELAVMINQLLSCYRICKGAIVKARPLSTKTQLLEQLDRFKGKRGAKNARRALTYAVAETASPAEAKVAALLTLPARWGGKGLPLPEANAEIVLTTPGTYAVPGTQTTTMVANTCPAQKHTTKPGILLRPSARRNWLTHPSKQPLESTPRLNRHGDIWHRCNPTLGKSTLKGGRLAAAPARSWTGGEIAARVNSRRTIHRKCGVLFRESQLSRKGTSKPTPPRSNRGHHARRPCRTLPM